MCKKPNSFLSNAHIHVLHTELKIHIVFFISLPVNCHSLGFMNWSMHRPASVVTALLWRGSVATLDCKLEVVQQLYKPQLSPYIYEPAYVKIYHLSHATYIEPDICASAQSDQGLHWLTEASLGLLYFLNA